MKSECKERRCIRVACSLQDDVQDMTKDLVRGTRSLTLIWLRVERRELPSTSRWRHADRPAGTCKLHSWNTLDRPPPLPSTSGSLLSFGHNPHCLGRYVAYPQKSFQPSDLYQMSLPSRNKVYWIKLSLTQTQRFMSVVGVLHIHIYSCQGQWRRDSMQR